MITMNGVSTIEQMPQGNPSQVEKPATSVENLPTVGAINETPISQYEKPAEVTLPVENVVDSVIMTPEPSYKVTAGYPLSQNSADVPALEIVLAHIKNEIPVD